MTTIAWDGATYTCHKCVKGFTYRSGLIEERICAICRKEELVTLSKAASARWDSIQLYEKSLYGADVYEAYMIKTLPLSKTEKTLLYNMMRP